MLSWKIVKQRLRIKKARPKNSTYNTHKEMARALILTRLQFFNQEGKFTYRRVAIRDQKRCWGSCSSKGNLNFSYKLLFLPPCLRDYIVVHELCHLHVLNHSAEFWQVVAQEMPDYRIRMQTLRSIEKTIGTSITSLKKYQSEHHCSSCEQLQALV
ncbi:M48 family metallopeptidase [Patescibacteria group bacterium]|nr:M48 family metallopeptidase [Patescibacteria group bacterium]